MSIVTLGFVARILTEYIASGELFGGAILSLILASPFWFFASGAAIPLRSDLSKSQLFVVHLPSLISLVILAAMTVLPIVFYYLDELAT